MQKYSNISAIINGASGLFVVVPAFLQAFLMPAKELLLFAFKEKQCKKKPGATTVHPWLMSSYKKNYNTSKNNS